MEKLKFIGKISEGDFEENTMTFKIKGSMILKAGYYRIIELSQEEIQNIKEK